MVLACQMNGIISLLYQNEDDILPSERVKYKYKLQISKKNEDTYIIALDTSIIGLLAREIAVRNRYMKSRTSPFK